MNCLVKDPAREDSSITTAKCHFQVKMSVLKLVQMKHRLSKKRKRKIALLKILLKKRN